MKYTRLLAATALGLMITACSTGIKRADIPATANPNEEIARIDEQIKNAYTEHADVLAPNDLEKSQSYLAEAKEDLRDGDDQKDILKSVGYSQAFLDRAMQKSKNRKAKFTGVIEARQKAIDAGSRSFPPTTEQMKELDDAIRSSSSSLEKMSASDTTDLAARYLVVELNAIKSTQLGKAASHIDAAKNGRASKYAPAALRRAELDIKTAENLIQANRNSTQSYAAAVSKANLSATLLTGILAATREGDVDENTATRLVMQDRKIGNLKGELGDASDRVDVMGQVVANQGKTIRRAGTALDQQKSMETARKAFSEQEAEVFQQGNQLVIRLKTMQFASGRSDLPSSSLPILAKVKDIADELKAKSMRVEGHTDSTGSASKNRELSEARAQAIAQYFESSGMDKSDIEAVGMGFNKPIASNKSGEGRAQNRRVDIVLMSEPVRAPNEAIEPASQEM